MKELPVLVVANPRRHVRVEQPDSLMEQDQKRVPGMIPALDQTVMRTVPLDVTPNAFVSTAWILSCLTPRSDINEPVSCTDTRARYMSFRYLVLFFKSPFPRAGCYYSSFGDTRWPGRVYLGWIGLDSMQVQPGQRPHFTPHQNVNVQTY